MRFTPISSSLFTIPGQIYHGIGRGEYFLTRRNFSTVRDNPNWLGLEIGTLTKRSGDLFQPNTRRLGVNWGVAKHITVSPQIYWNGAFKQVSPGFRIGIGL
jgi:hypothetical protein